ncbi:hypothetical protein NC652_012199 [Populus alba x Populus x berolinensis]|uniref:Transmembrane protein n=1 Tax=Populus tomentosa TaxID=118781 RepID=A0A8X8A4R8_POPTO|nr:hypothetical protein POTOM_016434 [Populus tomentosa]KAJ6937830.1 hypothetical protein NC652_012199 [Populus alba x Populus x berolinensis]
MSEISGGSRSVLLLFFLSLFLLFISGISDDSSGAKNETKADPHAASKNNDGPEIAIVFVFVVAIGFFAFFLFKFWQKKKREEQYARLLKLFEEDDELEVELGLRD